MRRRMKKDKQFTETSQLTAVRLPNSVVSEAKQKCQREDINFSQLMRRALRRELGGGK